MFSGAVALGLAMSMVPDVVADVAVAVEAVEACPHVARARRREATWIAVRIALAEAVSGVPEDARGMALAAACSESGYDPDAEGDYRDGKPRALGLFQLWPWAKVDRTSVEEATLYWLRHIQRVKVKTDKRCGNLPHLASWRAAWVTAIRSPARTKADIAARCRQTPKHWNNYKGVRAAYDRWGMAW